MSDLATVANRVIPITVELYTQDVTVYAITPITVNMEDSKYIIQYTLTNKDLASPYAVAITDLSSAERIELIFRQGNSSRVNLMSLLTDGTDGVVDYTVEINDFPSRGLWDVFARVIYGDINISYPIIPFLVE
jgi:hypothetical protein